MKIVLIGGGNAAKTILEEFAGLDGYEIVGVVDPVDSAPGMQKALELGIETGDNKAHMIQQEGVSLVFELTGIKAVEDEVRALLKPRQQMVSSFGALITCSLIESHDKKTKIMAERVGQRFKSATGKIEDTLDGMKGSAARMDNLLRHGHLVSLNAKVEAARAGESGKAFSVVVDEIQHLVSQLKSALEHIQATSEVTESTLEELRRAQAELTDSRPSSAVGSK